MRWKRELIPKELRMRLKPTARRLPKLHGLSKTHKPHVLLNTVSAMSVHCYIVYIHVYTCITSNKKT